MLFQETGATALTAFNSCSATKSFAAKLPCRSRGRMAEAARCSGDAQWKINEPHFCRSDLGINAMATSWVFFDTAAGLAHGSIRADPNWHRIGNMTPWQTELNRRPWVNGFDTSSL